MKTSQLKIKTSKITVPILKTLLFMVLIGAVTSCNNKKDASADDKKEKVTDDKKEKAADDKKKKVADADHTFDITLVKDSETIEFSENILNKEGNALYNNQQMPTGKKGDRRRSIMMTIGKDYNRGEAGVFGLFVVNEDFKPLSDINGSEKQVSSLTIRPEKDGDWYSAVSGTLTFSDLKFVLPTPNLGGACFKLSFEGDFKKNDNKKDIYQGSGTIVLSPKRAMGVYKEK
ncbi:hypothetical protein [Aequorivita capsosiphonis]|uniref:hypothetical protein n=1 Tax=Aequorivita capsosiphonis TaxID=487317 RepID=UPI00047B03AC|nr:hypothetical protein [Aequorivita capsosiphonis]